MELGADLHIHLQTTPRKGMYLSQYDEEYNKNRALDAKRVWDKHLCKVSV